MYKGIIFDLDGTLLNTIDDLADSINFALVKNGFGKYDVQEVKYLVGSGVDILIKRALSKYSYCQEDFENVKKDYMEEYVKLQKNKTAPYQGIVRLLEELKKMNVKVGVVSNKPYSDTLNVVNYYFDKSLFFSIYGKKEGYEIKPNPRAVNEMIDEFELSKEEVLFCGDSDVDIQTAHNAHLDSIGVLWGFRTKEELQKQNPTYIVSTPEEIIDIVNH